MHCDVVFFKEVSHQFFPKFKQCLGSHDGDVITVPGFIVGKDLLFCFCLFITS